MNKNIIVLETDRLILRKLSVDDAEFILDLLNQPSFLQFIGDRGVRTLDDACGYILKGPVASYERFGFGLYLTVLKDSGVSIGICGLVKRESLEDVDVGFAFLPQFWSKGYAFESASAVMIYGKNTLGLKRIVGVTSVDNHASIRVLEKLGLRFAKMVRLSADDQELKLFAPDEKLGYEGTGTHAKRADNIPAQIAELDELRKKGIVTDAEFQAKKKEMLAKM